MLDIFLEPEDEVYCPTCGQVADLFRGQFICDNCYKEEECNGY